MKIILTLFELYRLNDDMSILISSLQPALFISPGLDLPHLRILAVHLKKAVVGSFFRYTAIFQKDYPVRIPGRGKPVGYVENRLSFRRALHGLV